MTTEKFTVAGTTLYKGATKVRFANDLATRIKTLVKNGHDDIELFELPNEMTKPEALAWLATQKLSAKAAEAVADKASEYAPKVKKERAPKAAKAAKKTSAKPTKAASKAPKSATKTKKATAISTPVESASGATDEVVAG